MVNRVLISETESVVVQIWRESAKVYRSIVNFTCDDGNVFEEGIFKIAREWVLLFLSLEGKRTGYERQRITPYIHILVYHIPRICSQHNGLRNFSAQGMEKLNDTVKSINSKKSNKFGAHSDVVKVTCRQNQLAGQKRTSHCYTKSDSEYCEKTIFEKRHRFESPAQRVPSAPVAGCSTSLDVESLSGQSGVGIKAKLSELGVKTKLRNEKKLRELLTLHLHKLMAVK